MRLSKIKLAGFKSFVDPTVLQFPSNLTGIVGPNGCGKSNVIDAVRWVMGETSAKYLRGDSMADVIFNGSSARKPVGTASIELIFDNSDGSVGGQYANYAEISVRRMVSRDGTSSYFLNGTRCRRRDITDIFLGTGLGPRSYAIIEQGMISRLIEAKPEELRVFLEEAAGISKYKERRRETENRIRHTRENLERLSDLRDEIGKQLQHLQRQARTAERYKVLKEEERRLKAELLALRWRDLDAEVGGQDKLIQERETAHQAAMANLREVERELEQARSRHDELTDALSGVQARYYEAGAAIARVEQALQHARELRKRQQTDLEQTEFNWQEVNGHIRRDAEQLDELQGSLAELEPALARAREAESGSGAHLAEAEQAMQRWQEGWEAFNVQQGDASRSAQVERTRIEHLERRLNQALTRSERLEQERQALSTEQLEREISELGSESININNLKDTLQEQLEEVLARLTSLREEDQQLTRELGDLRDRLAADGGRLSSLEALQQAALGKSRSGTTEWLQAQGLDKAPRLAEVVEVASGWERAVETVLGFQLEAVCVDELASVADALARVEAGSIVLMETGARPAAAAPGTSLAAFVSGPVALDGLLGGVQVAQDLDAALRRRETLAPDQSVITPDGLWFGPNWVRVIREDDGRSGTLAREQEIKSLKQAQGELQTRIEADGIRHEEIRGLLRELEQERESLQGEVNRAHRHQADLGARLDTRRSRLEQVTRRIAELDSELAEIRTQIGETESELRAARAQLEAAVEAMGELEQRREALAGERDSLRERLQQVREAAQVDRQASHELALKVEARRSTMESTARSLERMREQLEQLTRRREQLAEALAGGDAPIREQEAELTALLQARTRVEGELGEARHAVEEVDAHLREREQARVECERKAEEMRDALESLRLGSQEIRVRRQTLVEQLDETGFALEAIFEELPEDADSETWAQRYEGVGHKIQRLGAINLAAIEEYSEQSERKEYLDRQNEDLTEALSTLENAIRKIDRETRTRFKETFDKVNAGLQATFPRLFGGGHAYLELTGEELLDAGVAVMARPPGKRNSTIHLLSGGEKALTAVALVFAIFELNPAPFCMLDEVDAPLDDANVGRFCALVREMSERVQFVFITHNKTTMELSNQLTGVTMHEPGVSRLVNVDVDEAVQMAAM